MTWGSACLAGLLSASGSASADAPSHSSANLERGFWLRSEMGWGSGTIHREHNSEPIDQTLESDGPTLALGIGYAPARWLAVGFHGDLSIAQATLETPTNKLQLLRTNAFTGVGVQLYPFEEFGLNFGLAGGWAFAYMDDSVDASLMMGPGLSVILGLDSRILQVRQGTGEKQTGARVAGKLLGAGIRFDWAPRVESDDYAGNAHMVSFVLTGTL